MTSQLNVDTIVDKAGSGGSNVKMANTSTYVSDGGNATQNTVQGLAKFWIAMNGSGTPTAIDSFNVGSITDVGTGNYKYNFSNNFSTNTGYWTIGTMANSVDHNGTYVKLNMPINNADILTSSVETSATYTGSGSTGDFDYPYVNMAGLGDLA